LNNQDDEGEDMARPRGRKERSLACIKDQTLQGLSCIGCMFHLVESG